MQRKCAGDYRSQHYRRPGRPHLFVIIGMIMTDDHHSYHGTARQNNYGTPKSSYWKREIHLHHLPNLHFLLPAIHFCRGVYSTTHISTPILWFHLVFDITSDSFWALDVAKHKLAHFCPEVCSSPASLAAAPPRMMVYAFGTSFTYHCIRLKFPMLVPRFEPW